MKTIYKFITLILLYSSFSSAQTNLKPWIGINIEKSDKGILITNTFKGTPANKAGLKVGDIIQKIDGKNVTNPDELISKIQAKGIGHDVKISYLKAGKKESVLILALEAKPGALDLVKKMLLNKKAPNFNAKILSSSDPKFFELSKSTGKPTIIEFWATWCGACMQAHPTIMEFAEDNKDKINVLAISDEEPKKIKKFLYRVKKQGMAKNSVLFLQGAETDIQKNYFVPALPMFIVLDKNNIVKFITIGTGKNLLRVFEEAKKLL